MKFVLDGLFVLIVLFAVLTYYSYSKADKKDARINGEKQQEENKKARHAHFESDRHRSGAKLVCVACDPLYRFLGPLLDTGCPQCHTEALILTEDEYESAYGDIEKSLHNRKV